MAMQAWVELALHEYAISGVSITDLAEKYGKRRGTLSKHVNSPRGRQLIERLRREHFAEIRRSGTSLATKAHGKLEQVLDSENDSATLARVALDILERMGLIADVNEGEAEAASASDAADRLRFKIQQIRDREPAA